MKKAKKTAAAASRASRSGATTARAARRGRSTAARSNGAIPEDIARNTYTRDRQPGLYTRVLRRDD